MGEQNKKRRKSSPSPKPTSSFPLDLTSEILLRLPAKSIVRFRCVSKLWLSITTEPYFINSFKTRSSTEPSLLFFLRKEDKLFVFLLPQDNSDSKEFHSYSQPLESYQMTYPKNCSFSPTESVHGLICFRKKEKPIIWNPTMRHFLTLSKPEKSWKSLSVFLGYDPIDCKHKVVCMPFGRMCGECRVLTLGSTQESWRSIKTNHKHCPDTESYGRCINGVLYYKAFLDLSYKSILMSFDVRSEKFDMIELPPNNFGSVLIPFEGRLGCVISKNLLVLDDAKKHKWSSKHSNMSAIAHYTSLKTMFKLSGTSHAGEFIYVPSTFLPSFGISYFDPKRNGFGFRNVEFEGILDDQLGNISSTPLHTFPNHIQTLISL